MTSSFGALDPAKIPGMTAPEKSQGWPDAYAPARATIFASNRQQVDAPPATVWAWLLRAGNWPEWYPEARDIHFLSHTGPDLRNRTRFRWHNGTQRVTSKVLEFDPERRIAWNTHGIGLDAYQIWTLTPTSAGTEVLTECTGHGWRARLTRALSPTRLERSHILWLHSLAQQAQSGPPA